MAIGLKINAFSRAAQASNSSQSTSLITDQQRLKVVHPGACKIAQRISARLI
jgi:hypothetical protein